MKRSITLFFCLLLSAALYCGTLAVTSTDPRGLMTQIGTTMSFDVTYTKGDETNISVTIAYYYVSATAPAATTYLSYFPEADSTGTITTMTRYIAATGHYTFAIQIPDKCYYVVISFDHTSGTPTGTVVLAGYLNDWR
jgi:hypothetical protein